MPTVYEIIAVAVAAIAVLAAPLVALSYGRHRYARPRHLWAIRERIPWEDGELILLDVVHVSKPRHQNPGRLVIATAGIPIGPVSAIQLRREAVLAENRAPQRLEAMRDPSGTRVSFDVSAPGFESTLIAVAMAGRGEPVWVEVDGGSVPALPYQEPSPRDGNTLTTPPGISPPAFVMTIFALLLLPYVFRAPRITGSTWMGVAGLLFIAVITFAMIFSTLLHRHRVGPMLRLRWGNPDLSALIPHPAPTSAPS